MKPQLPDKKAGWALVLCLILSAILVGWLWINARGDKTALKRTEVSSTAAPQRAVAPTNGAAAKPVKLESKPPPATGIRLGKYIPYLDSLCPRLTVAEEDALLLKTNRAPEMLVALAMMGSKRGLSFIEEALKVNPPSPLALSAAISRGDYKGDKLALAKALGGRYGGFYEAYLTLRSSKGPEDVTNLLLRAASSPMDASWVDECKKVQEAAYVAAGRDASKAKARVTLEGHSTPEVYIISKLRRELSEKGGLTDPKTIAPLIQAHESIRDLPSFDLGSYESSHLEEMELLEMLQTVTGADKSEYLNVPITRAIAEAKQDQHDIFEVLMFTNDKPGIYQRMSTETQENFINRIQAVGEVKAYQELFETQPQLFKDPEFPPQGITKEDWKKFLHPGKG